MTTIYAATSNRGKLAEFARSASGAGVLVCALPGLEGMAEPVEDADTFMGNAEKKAVAYSLLAQESVGRGVLVMADDSGIEVEALGGRPGVRSARWAEDEGFEAGTGGRDERNNRCLLARLEGVGAGADRRARYVCALVVAREGEVLLRAEGVCEGELLRAPRGEGGFGYDPLFVVPGLGRTMSELEAEEKWAVSHRGRAFRELLAKVEGAGLGGEETLKRV